MSVKLASDSPGSASAGITFYNGPKRQRLLAPKEYP